MKTARSMWRILMGIGVALVIILLLGTMLAKRLLVFVPDNLVLASDKNYEHTETTEENLAVFAESANLTSDSVVEGYALVMANEVDIEGTIEQDLSVMAEHVTFSGHVEGHAIFFAEEVEFDGTVSGETAIFAQTLILNNAPTGEIMACVENLTNSTETDLASECHGDAVKTIFQRAGGQFAGVWFASILQNPPVRKLVRAIFPMPLILLLSGLSALVVAIFPRAISNIEATIRTNPVNMLLTGLFLYLLMIGVTVGCLLVLAYASIVGLLLLLVYMLLVTLFSIFVLAGWVTLSSMIGNWLIRRFSQRMFPPIITTAIGGLVLTVLIFAVSWLPLSHILLPILVFILETAGLGGSFATRLGRRVYIPTRA